MKRKTLPKVEILAPAGSYESFLAAIHAGSDAVYLGGSLFSARAFAENFSKEQLLNAIDYAHLHGRKVYMTVNTLLKEEELKQLPEYLLPYYRQGLDAVIVQDMGVLELIANVFPDMAIHLSTQMTLTGSMGARLFEKEFISLKYPVTRFVPARELSLEELKKLREETNLELEVFVHGALCVSYSGQCFLSSMLGGRSGNRGRCAQPCRKLYWQSKNMTARGSSYFLSPKDLCTLELIPDLIEAGINSFKIEGRMKKPEYVAYISKLYQKYVNRFFQYGRKEYENYFKKYPQELEQDLNNIKDLYNRGGCCKGYFFHHHSKDMMSMERPNHMGLLVGKVTAVKRKEMEILWKQEIHSQDILEIESQGKKVYEYTVGQGRQKGEKSFVKFLASANVRTGMEVFRTRNHDLLLWIQKNIIQAPLKKKLYGRFCAAVGKEVSLTIWEAGQRKEEKNGITVTGAVCQEAQKQPLSKEDVRRQLSKLTDTEFVWETLEIELYGSVFLPIKSLNELRRKALETFQINYLKNFVRKKELKKELKLMETNFLQQEMESLKENQPKIAAEILTLDQWQAALSSENVSIIYARMELLRKEELIFFAEETKKKKKQCLLSLPIILRQRDRAFVKDMIESFLSCDGFLLHNLEELGFILEILGKNKKIARKEWELVADFSMYTTNTMAMNFWHTYGCKRVTASIEQNFEEIQTLFFKEKDRKEMGLETEFLLYGRIPLMVSAQCIASYGKNRDCVKQPEKRVFINEKNDRFYAMNFCRFCYNILYSGKELDLFDKINEILQVPFQVLRCSFTDETKQETIAVLNRVKQKNNDNVLLKQGFLGHFHKGMI